MVISQTGPDSEPVTLIHGGAIMMDMHAVRLRHSELLPATQEVFTPARVMSVYLSVIMVMALGLYLNRHGMDFISGLHTA